MCDPSLATFQSLEGFAREFSFDRTSRGVAIDVIVPRTQIAA
jgi:hypothetical protein